MYRTGRWLLLVAWGCVAGCAPGDDDGTVLPDARDGFADDASDAPPDVEPEATDRGEVTDCPPDRPPAEVADDAVPEDAAADESSSTVEPPLGGSSGGGGGSSPVSGSPHTSGGTTYRLIVPSTYSPSSPAPFLVVYSGTEGDVMMATNLQSVAAYAGLSDFIIAVLDGVTYNGNGDAALPVIDDLRAQYNIDNDRTYLLSESAGTTAGLELGFQLRPSYFAAFWVNDINASGTPSRTAAELGFAPWGNAGPGGDLADATAVVAAMRTAGYRLPSDAPYSGSGSGTHGSPDQFIAACQFFPDKSR